VGFKPTVRLPVQRFSSSKILVLVRAAVANRMLWFAISAAIVLARDAYCHPVSSQFCTLVCNCIDLTSQREHADSRNPPYSCRRGLGGWHVFFAYVVLRQSVGSLEPAVRLALWYHVFRRFFPWVWVSIILLLVSGYGMLFLYFGGFARAAPHIYVMQATGIVMMLLFLHLFFAPWRRFGYAVERDAFSEAAKELSQIRRIVAINLVLGLLTVIVGASGRSW
jgi:uncharacterized membrane protein